MGLTFCGAGTDGRPADQIGDVLGHDRIQKLGRGRHAFPRQIKQQTACPAQTSVDVVRAVQMRIIDQPLPADSGARFFEIDPHHHFKLILQTLADRSQSLGVLPSRRHVMHGAGTHHHQQTLVISPKNRLNALSGRGHGLGGCRIDRQILMQQRRSDKRACLHHMQIRGGDHDQGRDSPKATHLAHMQQTRSGRMVVCPAHSSAC